MKFIANTILSFFEGRELIYHFTMYGQQVKQYLSNFSGTEVASLLVFLGKLAIKQASMLAPQMFGTPVKSS
jgi:predicted SpoU family rRNA methylase